MTDEDVRTTFEGIVMHSIINYTSPPAPREVASRFYTNTMGGIARDIWVDEEAFIRFFELVPWHLVQLKQGYWPHIQKHHGWDKMIGSVSGSRYRITFISGSPQRVSELLQIAPYLWQGSDDCDPHGIERPTSLMLGDLP